MIPYDTRPKIIQLTMMIAIENILRAPNRIVLNPCV